MKTDRLSVKISLQGCGRLLGITVLAVLLGAEGALAREAGPRPEPDAPVENSRAGDAPAGDLPGRSDRIVSYRIAASLDHEERTVRGEETIVWRNRTSEEVGELQFHLYLNAFKNEKTTFMKESRGRHRGFRMRDGYWGYVDLESMRLAGGSDLLDQAGFIRPDDGNPDDETVLRVPLPEPVEPGGEITVEVAFSSRLPRVFARTGFKNDFYLVAQWFPKLGVYEEAGVHGRKTGGWNCHQFHSTSEFYADFGSYDVSLTVPSAFVVGATGALAEPPSASRDGTTTYHFVQEDVHDFAWTADPDFVQVVRTFSYAAERDAEEERRMAGILGLDRSRIPPEGAADLAGVPEKIRLSDVEVTLLIQPEHRAQIDRHFTAVFNALRYFGYWYGRYPYETLTVVDPAYGGRGAGGMEYPTFITAGTRVIAPSRRHSPDGVTIHEFGHQYWYGLVANNEFEEAWLDEGLSTYSTGKVLEKAYGPDHDVIFIAGVPFVRFALLKIPQDASPVARRIKPPTTRQRLDGFLFLRWTGASNDSLLNAFRDLPFLTFPGDVPAPYPWGRRRRYLSSGPRKDELVRNAWEYYDRSSYALNSYNKTALTLRTLEGILGEENVALALRRFHERFRFGHPTTRDFIATVNDVAGRDMGWFFDQTLRGSGLLDYEIASAGTRPVKPGAGLFGPPGSRRTVTTREARAGLPVDGGGEVELNVMVRRLGEVRLPIRIHLVYEDGRTETRAWDGEYRWHRIREESSGKLAYARIGPEDGIPLDANWSNDARSSSTDRWPALKWWTRLVGWAQNVLFFYSGLS
jgi:hypothetical protein